MALFGKGCVFVAGGSGLLGSEICKHFAAKGSPVAFSFKSNLLPGFLVTRNNLLKIIYIMGLIARNLFNIRRDISWNTNINKSKRVPNR